MCYYWRTITAIEWQSHHLARRRKIIRKSPSSFNHLRDKGRLYDAQEATSLLWKGSVLSHLELTEEIISADGVFSEKGKQQNILF